MTDISAINHVNATVVRPVAYEPASVITTFLSGMLIIGLPAVFWISVMELTNFVLSLGLTVNTRLVVAGGLLGLLSMVWCFTLVAARQRRLRDQRF